MDPNSSKPAETGNPQVLSLQLALEWLDRDGGQQRNARALRELVEITLKAMVRGEAPPETDTNTLREILQRGEAVRSGDPVKQLRATELETWWAARVEPLRQVYAKNQCPYAPRVLVKPGGGRGLPSRLTFEFLPIEDIDAEATQTGPANAPALVRYQLDPAKPALWLRLLVGSRPFLMQSWRGYLLLGAAAFDMVLIALIWWAVLASWSVSRPVTTLDLAFLTMALLVTAGLWLLGKPIWQLPTRRVTLAGASLLAMSELYGQLRTMPVPGRKLKSREFAVVRHWGICSICSAEVDLDWGGKSFPDRLIGRCHDAPLEHVFSFDPVRLIGHPLRDGKLL
jgi:hypothetical protein